MNKPQIESWVKDGPSTDTLMAAEKLGQLLKEKNLTTSQIRQVFTRLKSIEAKGYSGQKTEFMMLKPYLAYASGRQKIEGLKIFKEKISCGIDTVLAANDRHGEQQRFLNFCKLFEAILAYHRASGGK